MISQRISVAGEDRIVAVPSTRQLQDIHEQYRHSKSAEEPYWGRIWPAAYGMVEYLLANKQLLLGKKVLELATGLGLPSLFSAPYCDEIWATDLFEEPLAFINASAGLNGISNLKTAVQDWNMPFNQSYEVVLMSDVNYAPDALISLEKSINRMLDEGKTIILSSPHRMVAREMLLQLNKNARDQFETTGKGTPVTVWLYKL